MTSDLLWVALNKEGLQTRLRKIRCNNKSPFLLIAFLHRCVKKLNQTIRSNNSNDTCSLILCCRLAEIGLKLKIFCGLTNAKRRELWNFTTCTDGLRINEVDRKRNCSQVWDDNLQFYELINSFEIELFDFRNKMMWSDVTVLLIFKFANNIYAMRWESFCPTKFSSCPLRTKNNLNTRRRFWTQIDEVPFNEQSYDMTDLKPGDG